MLVILRMREFLIREIRSARNWRMAQLAAVSAAIVGLFLMLQTCQAQQGYVFAGNLIPVWNAVHGDDCRYENCSFRIAETAVGLSAAPNPM